MCMRNSQVGMSHCAPAALTSSHSIHPALTGTLFSHAPSVSRDTDSSTRAHALNDVDLRDPQGEKQYVHVDLVGAEWLVERECCRGPQAAALLGAVLHSNKKATAKGFEAAFAAQAAKLDASHLERVNSTRVTIRLPALPLYKLPVSRVEQLQAQAIPAGATTAQHPISALYGSHSVVVYATAMSVHGSFWDEPIRTDDELRSVPPRGYFTVRIELEGTTWAENLNFPEAEPDPSRHHPDPEPHTRRFAAGCSTGCSSPILPHRKTASTRSGAPQWAGARCI